MLTLDVATVVFQAINFVILAVVLNRFVFRPILRSAAQSAAEKARIAKELDEERRKAVDLTTDLEQRRAKIDEEAREIVVQAREEAEAERQELRKRARMEAEQMLVEAQADAYQLEQQAMREFHEQLVEAILQICGNVISNVAPHEVGDSLTHRLSENIRELGRAEIWRVEALRRSLSGREATAHITSAKELSTEHQGELARVLTALADRRINIELEVDPKLVAGVRVRLGDWMMDNSIAGQLQTLRDQVSAALGEQVNLA